MSADAESNVGADGFRGNSVSGRQQLCDATGLGVGIEGKMLSAPPAPADGDKSAQHEHDCGRFGNSESILCSVGGPCYRGERGRLKTPRGLDYPADDAAPLDLDNQVRKSQPAKDQLARHRERRLVNNVRYKGKRLADESQIATTGWAGRGKSLARIIADLYGPSKEI